MRFVQHAAIRPHHCAAIPYMGNSNSQGFFDTGSELDGFDNHVYISVEAVAEMAQLMGWSHPSALDKLEREKAALQAQVDQLQAEVKEADKFAEAAEYTLGKFGAKVQKKPGRPPKEKVA